MEDERWEWGIGDSTIGDLQMRKVTNCQRVTNFPGNTHCFFNGVSFEGLKYDIRHIQFCLPLMFMFMFTANRRQIPKIS